MTYWLPCPNNNRYEVSSDGAVRDTVAKKESKGSRVRGGYRQVALIRGPSRKRYWRSVHRLIAEAFHGTPAQDGLQVNHKNGIKDDNRAENLEWVTPSENALHAYRTGLTPPRPRGAEHQLSKLNDAAIQVIRYFQGVKTQRQLARAYGVDQTTIWAIQKRRTWTQVYDYRINGRLV
jgi:hypothetical protein